MSRLRGRSIGKGKHEDIALPTADFSFSHITVKILTNLAQSNGSTPAQLSLSSGTAPTIVSEVLENMVEKGLVEKYEEDKIKNPSFVFYSLTPDGSRKFKNLKPIEIINVED